eukprot:CAMPEP_0170610804 /NCGR_PEP_ID=MMETSP0224-20130122/22856_1 /TAXON_ID=285029 /ORGANISM="Togula jolla, Strain CCCM 725" /LENGTH=84 /DNA_ID=CAMNT_0010936207 /DNA_START=683 /DNA_END=937 /DNA_ORIENTATION=-
MRLEEVEDLLVFEVLQDAGQLRLILPGQVRDSPARRVSPEVVCPGVEQNKGSSTVLPLPYFSALLDLLETLSEGAAQAQLQGGV